MLCELDAFLDRPPRPLGDTCEALDFTEKAIARAKRVFQIAAQTVVPLESESTVDARHLRIRELMHIHGYRVGLCSPCRDVCVVQHLLSRSFLLS